MTPETLSTSSAKHCGYCSEGDDGECDGVDSVAAEAAAECLILRNDKRKLESQLKKAETTLKKIANVKNWQRVPSEFINIDSLAALAQEYFTATL